MMDIDKQRLWEALLKTLDDVDDNVSLSRYMERQLSTIINIEIAWLLITDDNFFSADNILNNINPDNGLSPRSRAYYYECKGDLNRNLRKFADASDNYRKAIHLYDKLGLVRDSVITKSKYILSNRSIGFYDDGLKDLIKFHQSSSMTFTKNVVNNLIEPIL